jgi:hypothetical protein
VDVHGQFACLLVDGEFDLWHGSYAINGQRRSARYALAMKVSTTGVEQRPRQVGRLLDVTRQSDQLVEQIAR